MDRLQIIKDRLLCDKPIDPRDIGWLIDEVEHYRLVILCSYVARLHKDGRDATITT